ncbi:MAG: hypothetical protein ACRCXX_07170 [Cetobacterium sp.]|uniref:hypothetical protein n=1 Tax=Cetobacterium sp. TaxID=2071632 RepID=UPI003F325BDD
MKNEKWSKEDVDIIKANMKHSSDHICRLIKSKRSYNSIRVIKMKIRKGVI